MLMMVSATFTGLIITSFEDALAAQVALTAFIPMLMGTGGNSGSQSSVTVIRALSLGEVEPADLFQIIWKEIRTAVLCGVVLSVACFAKIYLVDMLLMDLLSSQQNRSDYRTTRESVRRIVSLSSSFQKS